MSKNELTKVLEIKFGSHLYGTNTPESDLDLKGIYLPTAREIVLGSYPKTVQIKRNKAHCERNTKDDIDIEYFSLDRFVELLTDGQTVALDMLFAPDELCTHNREWINIWRALKMHQDKLLSKNVNAFVGYARQQAAKYGIKGSRMDALKRVMAFLEQLPEHNKLGQYHSTVYALAEQSKDLVSLEKTPLIEVVMIPGPNKVDLMPHLHVCGRKVPFGSTVQFAKKCFGKILEGYGQRAKKAHLDGGVDWKALSHAVRVNHEAVELLKTGHITFPCTNRDVLLAIKTGQLPYEQVAEMIEQGLADLYTAQDDSVLQSEPDLEFAKDLVAEVYTKVVKESK